MPHRRKVGPSLKIAPASRAAAIVGTAVFCLVVWFLRRPDQLLHPYVWVEEFKVLNAYQGHGALHAAVSPYQGYFLWPSSFTVAFAAATSFLHVPLIDYWMSTAWFVATVCLILLPASTIRLRWRLGIAVLMVLAPMNPEVYGIALYAFWWTTLWPLISLMWSKDYWWLRIPVLIVGGMSSLAGAAMVVPYGLMFILTRRRRDLIGTAVLGVTFVVQSIAYLTDSSISRPIRPVKIAIQELRNFADYALAWLRPIDSGFLALAGAGILLGIAAVVGYAACVVERRTPTRSPPCCWGC